MCLSLHTVFSPDRAAVIGIILERFSGLILTLEMKDHGYLKLSNASSLWSFTLPSLNQYHFILFPHGDYIKAIYQLVNFYFLFFIYNNVVCKGEVSDKSSPKLMLNAWHILSW